MNPRVKKVNSNIVEILQSQMVVPGWSIELANDSKYETRRLTFHNILLQVCTGELTEF
jgi:hypothetical protein